MSAAPAGADAPIDCSTGVIVAVRLLAMVGHAQQRLRLGPSRQWRVRPAERRLRVDRGDRLRPPVHLSDRRRPAGRELRHHAAGQRLLGVLVRRGRADRLDLQPAGGRRARTPGRQHRGMGVRRSKRWLASRRSRRPTPSTRRRRRPPRRRASHRPRPPHRPQPPGPTGSAGSADGRIDLSTRRRVSGSSPSSPGGGATASQHGAGAETGAGRGVRHHLDRRRSRSVGILDLQHHRPRPRCRPSGHLQPVIDGSQDRGRGAGVGHRTNQRLTGSLPLRCCSGGRPGRRGGLVAWRRRRTG